MSRDEVINDGLNSGKEGYSLGHEESVHVFHEGHKAKGIADGS